MALQLAAIVPVDAEHEFARLKDKFERLLSERCGNTSFKCGDVSVFLASNDRARVPGGVDVIRSAGETVARYISSIAPFCDISNGSCESPEECLLQMANVTCVGNLEYARQEEYQLSLRRWYSLKRERAFLDRLLAACIVQGGVACVQGVSAEIAAHDAAVNASQPSLRKWWSEMFMAGSLFETFPCDAGKEPCLSVLMAPVLASKDVAGAGEAIDQLFSSFEPDPIASGAFFSELVQNVSSQPILRCGFEKVPIETWPPVCLRANRQTSNLLSFRLRKKAGTLITQSQADTLNALFRACWSDCYFWKAAESFAIYALVERNYTGANLSRYIRIRCESSACLVAATYAVRRRGFAVRDRFRDINTPMPKIYVVVLLTLSCVLLCAGLAIAVLAVFVWKVASLMIIYFVILAVAIVAVILTMASGAVWLSGTGESVYGFAASNALVSRAIAWCAVL